MAFDIIVNFHLLLFQIVCRLIHKYPTGLVIAQVPEIEAITTEADFSLPFRMTVYETVDLESLFYIFWRVENTRNKEMKESESCRFFSAEAS